MIGEYEEGGLKAPHIQSIINAQQALWIKKYIDSNEAQWKTILNIYLKPCGKTFLCYCNYAVDKLPKVIPIFYKNCLIKWQEIIQLNMYRTRLDQQMVWNNKEICVNGIPVYYEDFREAGLWTIKDLYENRKLRNFEFWKSKGIKHSRYLEWRGLISAISLKNKKFIKEDALSLNSDPILKISKNKEMVRAQCRDICKLLIKNIFCRPTAEKYYPNISQEDWKKIYLIPWQCSMDTKSRAFQYSFLQRIIVTNVKL